MLKTKILAKKNLGLKFWAFDFFFKKKWKEKFFWQVFLIETDFFCQSCWKFPSPGLEFFSEKKNEIIIE